MEVPNRRGNMISSTKRLPLATASFKKPEKKNLWRRYSAMKLLVKSPHGMKSKSRKFSTRQQRGWRETFRHDRHTNGTLSVKSCGPSLCKIATKQSISMSSHLLFPAIALSLTSLLLDLLLLQTWRGYWHLYKQVKRSSSIGSVFHVRLYDPLYGDFVSSA